MNTPTVPKPEQKRLRAHFAFTGLPFRKNVGSHQMFDSTSQRQLLHGLHLAKEIGGLSLVAGPSGAGKSITLRRFVRELPKDRFRVLNFGQIPTSPSGFLRALSRRLLLTPRLHAIDTFDAARQELATWVERNGTRPLLILDDAEGMTVKALDLVRRLTSGDLDAEDRFNVLLIGTDKLLETLRAPSLGPLRTRFSYVETLRPFSIEDTRNYVRFHMRQAGSAEDVLSADAITRLFQASQGVPRAINQLGLQALISAAVQGYDKVDGDMMKRVIHSHPLYGPTSKRS